LIHDAAAVDACVRIAATRVSGCRLLVNGPRALLPPAQQTFCCCLRVLPSPTLCPPKHGKLLQSFATRAKWPAAPPAPRFGFHPAAASDAVGFGGLPGRPGNAAAAASAAAAVVAAAASSVSCAGRSCWSSSTTTSIPSSCCTVADATTAAAWWWARDREAGICLCSRRALFLALVVRSGALAKKTCSSASASACSPSSPRFPSLSLWYSDRRSNASETRPTPSLCSFMCWSSIRHSDSVSSLRLTGCSNLPVDTR